MEKITKLALRCAEAQERVNMLAQMNQPENYEERIKADAAYRLASDALARCEQEYRKEMNAMTTNDLIGLTKAP